LQDYIAVKEKNAKYLPHSAGRYAAKRFRKAQCPIVERLTNSLMMHGRNNGKKLMAVRIVKHAFEIIHLLTGEVSMLPGLTVLYHVYILLGLFYPEDGNCIFLRNVCVLPVDYMTLMLKYKEKFMFFFIIF
jgi:hypothetical protein